jgi:NADH dehydrogenase FAD-containing subunit
MSEGNGSSAGRVVIVGGGVAGLEALLGLRDLLGDRVALTLVSQADAFIDRPMTVAEPFGFGSAARQSLPDIAAGFGAEFVQAQVAAVNAAAHSVSCAERVDGAVRGPPLYVVRQLFRLRQLLRRLPGQRDHQARSRGLLRL